MFFRSALICCLAAFELTKIWPYTLLQRKKEWNHLAKFSIFFEICVFRIENWPFRLVLLIKVLFIKKAFRTSRNKFCVKKNLEKIRRLYMKYFMMKMIGQKGSFFTNLLGVGDVCAKLRTCAYSAGTIELRKKFLENCLIKMVMGGIAEKNRNFENPRNLHSQMTCDDLHSNRITLR